MSTLLIYLLIFIFIRIGWSRLLHKQAPRIDKIKACVIVAARNETTNLPPLLYSLKAQTYPPELFEVLIIDDHSEVKIAELPLLMELKMKNLSVLELNSIQSGKKQALLHGAKNTNAELLIFTDADCQLPVDWVWSHVENFLLKKPSLTIGLVDYVRKDRDIASTFYRFDLLSLVISGTGTASLGFPTMCNGSNLSVKRNVFLSLADQYKNDHPSGDDVFLLHAVKKLKHEKISVLKTPSAVVLTNGPENLAEFLSQRFRWASKAGKYNDRDTIVLGSLVAASNTMLLIALTRLVFAVDFFLFPAVYIIKTMADSLIIAAGLKFFGGRKQLVLLPLFQFFYFPYVLISILGGQFKLFSWKGRKAN